MAQDSARALLLIDDEPAQGRLIGAIASRAGWRMLRAEKPGDALLLLGSAEGAAIDAVLIDCWRPGSEGIALIAEIAALAPALPVLVLTAQPSSATAIEALRAGAADFLAKPIAPELLIAALDAATNPAHRRGELRPLSERTPRTLAFHAIIGSSPEFRAALAIAAKAARSRVPVMIEGEAGVGRELVARAIHAASPRARRPFLAIDCAAVPANLIESALFGHERGAFLSAFDTHVGKLVAADGATLFIDRVAALSGEVQVKLLRAVQGGLVQPIGARGAREVDVRIIVGAGSDLLEQVEGGNFREDLYYALTIVRLAIPPLRDRSGDVPALARHLLARIAREPGMRALGITDDALRLLMRHDWPGNVRQLHDALFRAAIACEGAALTTADFPQVAEAVAHAGTSRAPTRPIPAFVDGPGVTLYEPDGHLRPLAAIEADVVRLAIGHYRGRMTEVARRLGIGRSTLYRKLAELGIDSAA